MTASISAASAAPHHASPVASKKFRRFLAFAVLAAGALLHWAGPDLGEFGDVIAVVTVAVAVLVYRHATSLLTVFAIFFPVMLFAVAVIGALVR